MGRDDHEAEKNDSTSTLNSHQRMPHKEFYFIVTAADSSNRAMERTIEGFRGFTCCLGGAKEEGIVYGTGAWQKGEIKGRAAMNQAYEMGKNV